MLFGSKGSLNGCSWRWNRRWILGVGESREQTLVSCLIYRPIEKLLSCIPLFYRVHQLSGSIVIVSRVEIPSTIAPRRLSVSPSFQRDHFLGFGNFALRILYLFCSSLVHKFVKLCKISQNFQEAVNLQLWNFSKFLY